MELEERQLVNEHCWVPEAMSANSHKFSISEFKSLMLTQESIKNKENKDHNYIWRINVCMSEKAIINYPEVTKREQGVYGRRQTKSNL